ncbi:MAG: HlyD family type I secretion periplasmic adaptor subunit [Victivallales bacterium]|nr:HlyD family type I secretion periplasmic adaptor subunit [Victivallales bacterium]
MSKKKMKIASDAIEFLPDAMEIEQEKLPWFAKVGAIWLFLILAAVIAWACIGEVDVIVKTTGHIVTDEGNIVMKPIESAIIREIKVRQGDIVNKGDVLITFDPSLSQADVDRIKREIEALEATFARYDAEFNRRDYNDESNQNTTWQTSIFKQRQLYYKEKINYYESNRNRLVAASKSTKERYDKYCEILDSMTKIEDMYSSLQKKNVVSYKETLEVTMSRMQNEVEVDKLRNQIVEYEHEILSLDAEKQAFIEEWRNAISEKMVETNRELESDRKQLAKAESIASYVQICAPCKAIVHDMAMFPVGSAVAEAEALITLVPLDGRLEVEAELRPQDIGRVHVGSDVRVKLSAFPFQKHGTLDGKVRLISGNTFSRQGEPAMAGRSYYRTFIVVTGSLRNVGDDFTLIPGMEVEAEIKSGRRRIIEYLVYPLIKGLDEAFKEP